MRYAFLTLIMACSMISFAQLDSVCSCRISKEKIIESSHWGKYECWMICGSDSSQIFMVDSCGELNDLSKMFRQLTNSSFTSIVAIGSQQSLVGTTNDYAFFYNRGKMIKIDSASGISDRSISTISFNDKKKKVYIEGTNHSFASIDSSFSKYTQFATYSRSDTSGLSDEDFVLDNYEKDEPSDEMDKNWSDDFFDWLKTSITDYIPEFKGGEPKHSPYISHRQFRNIRKQMRPCDILFKRVNWQWSNNIIPGFWTHTAIYVGGLHQLNVYFRGIPMLKGKKPSSYIRKHFPRIYRRLLRVSHPVIEAVPNSGVSINPLRHIARVDYFAAIRPELSKEDQFLSLLKSFEYYKQPYDYLMNFNNKKAMVCSQLVYQVFQPTIVKQGLDFELETLLGDPFLYPTDIVKKFDKEFGTENEELNFVIFYNARESSKKAELGTISEFRKTWRKSRFSLLQD